MARVRLEQLLSNLKYDATNNTLHVSGSNADALIITGSVFVTGSALQSGSLTINDKDTYGDKGTPDSVDLGEF